MATSTPAMAKSKPKRTALFTGAGASYAIGYPLTRDLLPRVRSGLKDGSLFQGVNTPEENREDREALRGYLTGLMPGFERAEDRQLPLITDVFSLVEHSIASDESLPIGGDETLRRCRDLLKHAITDLLHRTFAEPWNESDPVQTRQRDVLGRFTRWVSAQEDSIGIVTTNYDIGLEYEVYRRIGRDRVGEAVDLGFDFRDVNEGVERTRPAAPDLRVYKLHGSLDVLRCRFCGYVYLNPWGNIALHAFRKQLDPNNTCHCRDDARLELHIVAPLLVRAVRDANLLSVWRSALEWMRRAEHWVIVGYSLPPEDLAIRSLLIRAYAAAEKPPQITVVQWDETERPRYELHFPGCEYVTGGLEAYLARGD